MKTVNNDYLLWINFGNIEFRKLATSLQFQSGVYSFWGSNNQPLYIGKSSQVGKRICNSYENTWHKYLDKTFQNDYYRPRKNRPIFFKYILCNKADMSIIEAYLITKINPVFNVDCKTTDEPTIQFKQKFHWSQPFLCNAVKLKRWGL